MREEVDGETLLSHNGTASQSKFVVLASQTFAFLGAHRLVGKEVPQHSKTF